MISKEIDKNKIAKGQMKYVIKLMELAKQSAYKDVLNYLSERGFRESNYEIRELTKWLQKK